MSSINAMQHPKKHMQQVAMLHPARACLSVYCLIRETKPTKIEAKVNDPKWYFIILETPLAIKFYSEL